eukprot:1158808-Pelagomonas_calceolata.AAC.8
MVVPAVTRVQMVLVEAIQQGPLQASCSPVFFASGGRGGRWVVVGSGGIGAVQSAICPLAVHKKGLLMHGLRIA